MEACVAVIANSMTAFRSLFTTSSSRLSPQHQENSPPAKDRRVNGNQGPYVELPTVPSATLSGFRSMLRKDPFENRTATIHQDLHSSHPLTSFSGTSNTSNNRCIYPEDGSFHSQAELRVCVCFSNHIFDDLSLARHKAFLR